jgi:HD superfamily phosphohydrolase
MGKSMNPKIFRDPLYNYISIDRDSDKWLLELLDCPEMQRLRRIHQLGVSYITYPGADHNRLCHCLGVVHLMQQALAHLGTDDRQVARGRDPLLAAALLHDVGHGPFSHVFESCFGINHEEWSCRILTEDTAITKILKGVDPNLPSNVAALIDEDNHDYPCWQRTCCPVNSTWTVSITCAEIPSSREQAMVILTGIGSSTPSGYLAP